MQSSASQHYNKLSCLTNTGYILVGGDSKKVIGLVGKGLTFDSGGYNLKVGVGIEMMKFDMGGAAAVLGAAQAIAAIKPKGATVFTPSLWLHALYRPHTTHGRP